MSPFNVTILGSFSFSSLLIALGLLSDLSRLLRLSRLRVLSRPLLLSRDRPLLLDLLRLLDLLCLSSDLRSSLISSWFTVLSAIAVMSDALRGLSSVCSCGFNMLSLIDYHCNIIDLSPSCRISFKKGLYRVSQCPLMR